MATMNLFGAARAAGVLLSTLGGGEVVLLVPTMQQSSEATNGMGMAPAVVDELPVGPALVRKRPGGSGVEVVVSAESLRSALGVTGEQRVEDLMGKETRVRLGEHVLRIAAIEAEYFGGTEYLYRFQLED